MSVSPHDALEMRDYEHHQPPRWNSLLLKHYFARRNQEQPPQVTSLLVTPEELARAVGAPESDAIRVRDSFVTSLRSTMDGCLFPAGFDYYASWARERRAILGEWKHTVPGFVGHLVFACLAATESPEDPQDEGSYIARLEAMCESKLADTDLRLMPALWRYLSDWLGQSDASMYRRLVLPPDNGWTRIGYTVRLAFPSRRDQQALTDVLRDVESVGQDLPVAPVLFAVGNAIRSFRKRFQEVFIDFRTQYQNDHLAGSSLRDHAFWASVQSAAHSATDTDASQTPLPPIQLLAEVQDDRFVLSAVAQDEPPRELGFQADRLPWNIGAFAWLLSSSSADGIPPTPDQAVADILEGHKGARGLKAIVQQGVLLFAESDGGVFEVVADADTRSVRHALVRNHLAPEFKRRFSSEATIAIGEVIAGWTAFLDVAVASAVAPHALDGTALEHVWALQRGVPITRLRVVGGIRVEGGWLGTREVLPRISSHGDGELSLERVDETPRSLTEASDGLWSLPSEDFSGPVDIVQRYADHDVDRLHLELVSAPTIEAFKAPSNPATWYVESFGHSVSLDDRPVPSADDRRDWAWLADQLVLLGPAIGQFVTDPERAAWQIVRFGGRYLVRRGAVRGESAVPDVRVAADQLRRQWRKLIFNSRPDPSDPGAGTARSAIRRAAFDEHLPCVDFERGPSTFSTIVARATDPRVERLVTVLVARLNARKGMTLHDWYELLAAVFGNRNPGVLRSIARAWEEAGLIDVTSSTRWRSYMVYGRKPELQTFQCGTGWGATLTGLTLASTLRTIRKAADDVGLAVEDRGGCSERIPATLGFRSATIEAIHEVARRAGVGCLPVSFDALTAVARRGRSRAATPYPANYVDCHPAPACIGNMDALSDVRVLRWYRRDCPDFWEVVGGTGRSWTYDQNSACLWASYMSGLLPVASIGTLIVAERAFLPLAFARFLSIITGLRSGPCEEVGDRHSYPVHSIEAARWVMECSSDLMTVVNPEDTSRLAIP